MNSELNSILQSVVDDLDEASRAKALAALEKCHFATADDPTLGLLAILKLRSGQGQQAGLAGALSRMMNRFDGLILRLERWKWRNLAISWVLFFGLGMGFCGVVTAYLAAKVPEAVQSWLRLPPRTEYFTVSDERLLRLQEHEISWGVLQRNNDVVVAFGGVERPVVERRDANWLVVLSKRP